MIYLEKQGRKRRLRRMGAGLLSLIICLLSLTSPIGAQEEAYSWYCAHVRGHMQPQADGHFAFIRELGGWYLDDHPEHRDPNATDKVVYLTFDAGYENGNVEKTLDALAAAGATGAFFVLGHLVEAHPELIRRMAAEGHLVCNHSYAHKDMTTWSAEEVAAELTRLDDACRAVGVEPSPFFRPPEGRFSRSLLAAASAEGYQTVFWSFGYADWDNAKQPEVAAAKAKILDNLHNGEVMLLHPTSATNATILPSLLAEIRARGYRFGTLYELAGIAAPDTGLPQTEEESA